LLASEVGIVDSGEKKKQKTLTKADQIKKVKKEQKLRELQIKLNFDGGIIQVILLLSCYFLINSIN
jgi:hypothetical protein